MSLNRDGKEGKDRFSVGKNPDQSQRPYDAFCNPINVSVFA